MPTYSNGYIPDSLLITFNVGVSAGEGLWKHQLSAGTYAKHLALVALARKNTGRVLSISTGWGAYRPYAAQVYARQVHGNGAATPGTSSHGGFWERQQTLAIDYGNWSYVYGGSRDAFYRDARAVGFEPGLISPARGYPDEPWHVVDKQPWAGGSTAGGSATEEDDMTPDQSNMLTYIFNAVAKPYGSQLDAIANILRTETAPQIANAVKFPGQPYNGFQAIANNQGAILEAIKTLDPSKSADIAAFEAKLRESEARQVQALKDAVDQSVSALRDSITQALTEGGALTPEDVEKAVDEAFGKVYVQAAQQVT